MARTEGGSAAHEILKVPTRPETQRCGTLYVETCGTSIDFAAWTGEVGSWAVTYSARMPGASRPVLATYSV